ncbi:MAG: hypothetical protein K9G42_02740 [Pedobacter sp.]|nr:hypothetical protein [Pedobacter sp.]
MKTTNEVDELIAMDVKLMHSMCNTVTNNLDIIIPKALLKITKGTIFQNIIGTTFTFDFLLETLNKALKVDELLTLGSEIIRLRDQLLEKCRGIKNKVTANHLDMHISILTNVMLMTLAKNFSQEEFVSQQ